MVSRDLTITPLKPEAEVLLVDDNPADADLIPEILSNSKLHFRVSNVGDGVEALSFLHRNGDYVDSAVRHLSRKRHVAKRIT